MTLWGDTDVWVTRHAIERLDEHYPGVTVRSARGILNHAIECDQGPVMPVLGRRKPPATTTRFFLPVERRGFLVLEPETRSERNMPWVVVTYLRLELSQQELVARLWPKAAA